MRARVATAEYGAPGVVYSTPGFDARVVEDLSKATFLTPADAETLRRSLVTVTPAANQRVVIDRISGQVAFNGENLTSNTVQRARLLSKVVGFDASTVSLAVQSLSGSGMQSKCSDNVFTGGTRNGVGYEAPVGASVTVEFWMKRELGGLGGGEPASGTMTSYCLRNTVVEYRLATLPRYLP